MPTKDDVLPFIQEINNAIQQNSINQVSAAFYKLGKYLQEQYPGKNSEDIQKALGKNGINFSSFELPNLEMVTFLLRARENLADEGVENEERRNYLAAHLIGINCYLKVMDEPVLDAAQVSRTNKIFDIIGQAIRIFPQVAEENTRLAREVLLDFEKVKNTPEDFQKAGPQLTSLRNLELTDQVQDIKKVHLQEIGKRRIPPQLLAQEPKNIDKIQTIMLLLSQLKEISWSMIKDKVDPLEEKQAREDNKKIAKLADDIEKHLIEYYSGKQGLEEKIVLSEGMNHLLEENNNLIEKFDKNFIASLKKITLQPNELSKIKDLVEAFKTLAVEVQKIDEHNPDRKKILYFIEEGKKQFNSYYSGNRFTQDTATLEANIRRMIHEVEPAVSRCHCFNEKIGKVFSVLRDIITLGFYSLAKSGKWGIYQNPPSAAQQAVEKISQVTNSFKENLAAIKVEDKKNEEIQNESQSSLQLK